VFFVLIERPFVAGSGRSPRDHKAVVRHSGRVVRTLHSVCGTLSRSDFSHRVQTSFPTIRQLFKTLLSAARPELKALLSLAISAIPLAILWMALVFSAEARPRRRSTYSTVTLFARFLG